tara:strand:- start:581 stop:769 length:189 start_codon:yes stop_codon:yes gene_type:complete
MKKALSIIVLAFLSTSIAFAGDLGENMASDCVSTQQSSRYQQTLADGGSTQEVQSDSSSTGR